MVEINAVDRDRKHFELRRLFQLELTGPQPHHETPNVRSPIFIQDASLPRFERGVAYVDLLHAHCLEHSTTVLSPWREDV